MSWDRLVTSTRASNSYIAVFEMLFHVVINTHLVYILIFMFSCMHFQIKAKGVELTRRRDMGYEDDLKKKYAICMAIKLIIIVT